jgi:hypothetical protein
MTQTELNALFKVLTALADAARERLQGHDAEIAELREEIKRLKEGPRMSLAQKLRTRGQA